MSPAAVTEDQNVSQASSMRDAQLSGGSQQQRSPQLQSVSSAVSPVSSSEDNAGSEALPRPSFIQKHLLLKLTRWGSTLCMLPAYINIFCGLGFVQELALC